MLHTDGVAAHGAMPKLGDNALLKLGPILERFAARQPSFRLTEEPRAFLEAIGALGATATAARTRTPRSSACGRSSRALAAMLEPMLGVSLAPTRIFASEKINVIPSHARLAVDCRARRASDARSRRRRSTRSSGRAPTASSGPNR